MVPCTQEGGRAVAALRLGRALAVWGAALESAAALAGTESRLFRRVVKRTSRRAMGLWTARFEEEAENTRVQRRAWTRGRAKLKAEVWDRW